MRITPITSLANPQLKVLKKLATDNSQYKKTGTVYLEGEHLCEAFFKSAVVCDLDKLVASESAWAHWSTRLQSDVLSSAEVLLLPDSLMLQWSPLPITQAQVGIGLVRRLSAAPVAIDTALKTVVLDRVQDAGNVGSILRSAAVFGVQQIVALKGSAALWSPKVLRAAMGAHFVLRLIEDVNEADLPTDFPLLVTSSHQGDFLHKTQTFKGAWVFGHEGQGVSPALMQRAAQFVRIQQVGQESLNVAAAAAVCLYAASATNAR